MWVEIFEQVIMDGQFGERFREVVLRAKGDRPQTEFARELGVSSSAVQKWLSGNGFPSSENMAKIAKAAGLNSLDALLNYIKGEEPTANSPVSVEEILILSKKLDRQDRKKLIKHLVDLD